MIHYLLQYDIITMHPIQYNDGNTQTSSILRTKLENEHKTINN